MKNKRIDLDEKEFYTLKKMIAANKSPKIIIKTFKKNGMLTFSYASLKKMILHHFNLYWDIKNKQWVKSASIHPSYKIPKAIQQTLFTPSINQKQSENTTKDSIVKNNNIEKTPLNSFNDTNYKINLKNKIKPIPPLNELELAVANKESPYPLALPGNDVMTILKNIHFIEQTIKNMQKSINSMNHNLSALVNHYNKLD